MNLLAWLMCIGLIVWVMAQGVSFHRAQVCRQKNWLADTEKLTNALLSTKEKISLRFYGKCGKGSVSLSLKAGL